MYNFITLLKQRNEPLFYFGLLCLVLALVFAWLIQVTNVQVYGVNAWYKPLKFALSIFLFSWTMAWFCSYLPNFNISAYNWVVIVLLGFEIVYIAIQAGRGQLSHYNQTTPIYSFLYTLMALAATVVTLHTAYVGYLFFKHPFPELPSHYLWAIRIGIILFVIFSLEGFVMGSRLSHTIGGPDGEAGIPLLNWSLKYGDPRIPHFIGMHALQVLPLMSFYLLKNNTLTFVLGAIYAFLSVYTLVLALAGKPLFSEKQLKNNNAIHQEK